MTGTDAQRALARIERDITVAKSVRKQIRDRGDDLTEINGRIAELRNQAKIIRKQHKP